MYKFVARRQGNVRVWFRTGEKERREVYLLHSTDLLLYLPTLVNKYIVPTPKCGKCLSLCTHGL